MYENACRVGSENVSAAEVPAVKAWMYRSTEGPPRVIEIHLDEIDYDNECAIIHPHELPTSVKSSGWHMMEDYVIEMSYKWERISSRGHIEFAATHSDEIPTPAKSSLCHDSLAISHSDEIRSGASSYGWQMPLCHPDYKRQPRKPSWWHTAASINPDETLSIAKSSGWLTFQNALCHADNLG